MVIEFGKTYTVKEFPGFHPTRLHKVKVTNIYTNLKGTEKIVEYTHNFPFTITEYMKYEDFMDIIFKITLCNKSH